MELNTICSYRNERIPFDTIAKEDYVSTENLLPDKGGLKLTSSFPENGNVCAFYKGDVLISNIRPYFKKIWLADKDGGCSADVLVFKAKENINNKFLFYILSQDSFFDFVMQGAKGCKMPRGDKNFTMTFDVSKLPLKKQNEIASVLSSLDAKIETNNRLSEKLEDLAQAIFKSWFVDFEPFKNQKFHETELGMIPEGWEVGNLTDIAEYTNGLAMQKFRPEIDEDGIPVLKIKELKQGFCDSSSDMCTSEIDDCYLANDGDVIFSWSGTLYVDIWCGGLSGVNQHLFKVTSNKYPKWFYYYWTKHHLAEFIRIAKDKAVTMGHIKREHLRQSYVVLPDKTTMDKIDKILSPIVEQIISSRIEAKRLANLRDTLLPRLMSGEIKL